MAGILSFFVPRQITRLFRLSNTASPPRCVRERSPSRLALPDPRRAFTSQLKPLSCGPPLGPLPHYDAHIRINSSAKPSPVEIRRINEVKEKPRKNLPPEGEEPAEVKLGDKQDEIRLHVWVVREDQRAGTQSGREGENEVSRSARCVCIREALPPPPLLFQGSCHCSLYAAPFPRLPVPVSAFPQMRVDRLQLRRPRAYFRRDTNVLSQCSGGTQLSPYLSASQLVLSFMLCNGLQRSFFFTLNVFRTLPALFPFFATG